MAKNVIIGPWGCPAPQNKWNYEPKGAISHISITHADAIYSIGFTSEDEKGNVEHSRKFGNTTGSESAEVDIDIKNGEKLNYISGTSDLKDGYISITSLTFATNNKRILGPFGTLRGTAFSFHVPDESFTGFHGRSGSWLDAIGVYLQPKTRVCVGRWGSQDPGNEWSYEPKGAICHISITHDDAIYSISFTSQDDKGNLDHSKIFGAVNGSHLDEIDIDIKNGEKLNHISGTFGNKSGYVVVTSLSFSTDKNKVFGPFGTANGTEFSLLVSDEGFSGFHGRAGSWLDAIGVYLGPETKPDVGLRNCFGRKKSCSFCSIIILVLLTCALVWLLFPSHKKKGFLELLDHIARETTDFSLPVNYGVLNGFRGRFKQLD